MHHKTAAHKEEPPSHQESVSSSPWDLPSRFPPEHIFPFDEPGFAFSAAVLAFRDPTDSAHVEAVAAVGALVAVAGVLVAVDVAAGVALALEQFVSFDSRAPFGIWGSLLFQDCTWLHPALAADAGRCKKVPSWA